VTVEEFVRGIPNFADKNHPQRIKAFGWFLHTERKLVAFWPSDVAKCYRDTDLNEPANMGRFLDSLAEKKPPELLKDGRGYRLAQPVREKLDRELGKADVVIQVEKILTDILGKISDTGERLYYNEALTCYRHGAFRAAIVMVWNLAYDHLCRWVLADAERVKEFNAAIPRRNKNKAWVTIANRVSFEDLKEDEVIDILGYRSDFSDNLKRMLKEKLGRRNTYAHPSQLIVARPQVDDMITELMNNIVLAFDL
jgi:hypothetical protein